MSSFKTKTTLIAALLGTVAIAGAANAGGLAEPVAQAPVTTPVPAPVPVRTGGDWSGFYAGGQLGYGQIDADIFDGEPDGLIYGVHAGYNYDFGTFVLGGEIDYDATDDISDDETGIDLDAVARLKVRAGYDAGQFLPYVTAGYAQAYTGGALDADDGGYFAGLGVAYQLSDTFTVGGEVLYHEFDDFDDTDVDIEATTLTLRASYNF